MPRMELETMQPIEGFAVDVALKQASKDHVPELVDSNSGVTGVSNSRIGISEIPPAVKSDALGMDTLFKEASPVNATPGDLKPHGTHTHSVEDPLTKELDNHVNGNTASKADPLTKETNNHVNGNIDSRADPLAKETNNHINETIDSGADPLTKETNNHVNGNTTSSSSAGFMDKVDPPPTVTEGFVVDIPASPATRLKLRLENTKDLIVCPGVYDGLSARIALSVGCDAMYMTGAGTTASALGMADLGVATLTDMVRQADMIANLDYEGPPLIADMDTGYGGPITVASAVRRYIRANVAGFHIEDQVLTKRCGHLSGKKVVTQDVFLSRIRAAKAAKDRARSDIVLIARTDANQQLGYDECIARLRAARALGADCGLLEGFKSKEQARKAVIDLAPWPLLLNIVENGHSPLITVEEAREMGFRIMIFSFAAIAPAFGAIKNAYEKLKLEGVTGNQGCGVNPIKLFEVCGLREAMEVDMAAGGEDFKSGV